MYPFSILLLTIYTWIKVNYKFHIVQFLCLLFWYRVFDSIKTHYRIGNPLFQLFNHLIPEPSQCYSNIAALFSYYFLKEGSKFFKGCVGHIIKPRTDENTIIRLILEVFGNVINYNNPWNIPSKFAQILNKHRSSMRGMLSVQSVLNAAIRVKLIQDPVGIVLHRRSKYDHLI